MLFRSACADTRRGAHAESHGADYRGKRGNYVLIAKGNQAQLQKKVAALLSGAGLFEAEYCQAGTCERRCGRLEEREITVAVSCKADLATYLGFAGVQQVFKLRRRTQNQKNGVVREQTVWGITSLSAAEAIPDRLLSLARGHWHIENRSHWVRDVTFDEDRSQVRYQGLATFPRSWRPFGTQRFR